MSWRRLKLAKIAVSVLSGATLGKIVAGAIGVVAVDYGLTRYAVNRQHALITKRIAAGSMPEVPEVEYMCKREEDLKKIAGVIRPEAKPRTYSLIVGPAGCGKSWLVRKYCHEHPKVSNFII